MFRNPTIQRVISTLLTITFCTMQAAPVLAVTGSAATPPTAAQLIPLQAPSNTSNANNLNSVLLPVGSHSLPTATSGQGGKTTTTTATGTAATPASATTPVKPGSNPAASYAAALAGLHQLTLQTSNTSNGSKGNSLSAASLKALNSQYQSVVTQQQQMATAFAATQAYLTQQGLPSTILQRQQATVSAFTTRAAQLQQAMSALNGASGTVGNSANAC